jgi:SAM-dependent methyltransferase
MRPYKKFGAVYDKIGHDRFSLAMAEYTMELLARYDFRPGDGLDLCCGSGTAIEWFCDKGLKMSGLDQSPAMLSEARKKLKGRGVKLYRQELPRFDIRGVGSSARTRLRFDLVTCYFDSLNYLLTERALKAAFRATYQHLRPGGWFVFDMNTPYMFRSLLHGEEPISNVHDDIAWMVKDQPTDSKDTVDFFLTFFVKNGRRWDRFDEVHRERAYATSSIKRWLKGVGFKLEGCYRCCSFDPAERTTQRICVAARRPA